MDIQINGRAIDLFLRDPKLPVGVFLRNKGRRILARARRLVGVRTGALRSSLHMRHYRDPRGQYIKIGSNLRHAYLHHEGSRPHLIKPDKKQVLRFQSKGQIVMTHLVRHPGTKPNPYLTRALRSVRT